LGVEERVIRNKATGETPVAEKEDIGGVEGKWRIGGGRGGEGDGERG